MKFIKTRQVTSPTRANNTDAGIDFFVPTNLNIDEMMKLNGNKVLDYQRGIGKDKTITSILVRPNERILIPSGIHCKLPNKHALIAFNKSGIAAKTGLVVGSAVVDEGYEGEIHISLINTSDKLCAIKSGAKIVQFILCPVNYKQPTEVEIPLNEFYTTSKSTRKAGGFGSTDEKK